MPLWIMEVDLRSAILHFSATQLHNTINASAAAKN
jgi:hypothetical protein